jgi:hypothetical protein
MFWQSREWCCDWFRCSRELRNERGMFIFVLPPVPNIKETHTFFLGFRSVKPCDLPKWNQVEVPHNLAVLLSCHQAISHCPGCGVNLTRFYGDRAANLIDDDISREFSTVSGT